MNKILISFIITFIAGISTVLGIIPTFFKSKNQDNIINFSLSFSTGIMLTISLFSLIKESLNYLKMINPFTILLELIFINIGIIISTYIDKRLSNRINNKLLKVGLVGLISIIIHNIPEGIITFITTSNNLKIGIPIALSITFHNIPEGISIAIPIYYSTNSHKKTFIYTFISGFSEFIGALLAYLFLSNIINDFILALILGITGGIMIYISLAELLPTSLKYNNYKITIIGIILGIFIMLITI